MAWDPVARACSSTVVAQASQHCPRELACRVVLLVPLYFGCASLNEVHDPDQRDPDWSPDVSRDQLGPTQLLLPGKTLRLATALSLLSL
jgi:hypothetical protein